MMRYHGVSEKYQNVYLQGYRDGLWWVGKLTVDRMNRQKRFRKERDAALWVDKILIGFKKEPVNILKRKK